MNQDQVLDEFRAAGALLEGHFVLSSGLHSPVFFQKNAVFMDPARTERLCKALGGEGAGRVRQDRRGGVAGGGRDHSGLRNGASLGRARCSSSARRGQFQLRRGFEIKPGERVLMVEDVVTTGLSSRECLDAIRGHPGELVGAACLIDRSGGKADIGAKLVSLAQRECAGLSGRSIAA